MTINQAMRIHVRRGLNVVGIWVECVHGQNACEHFIISKVIYWQIKLQRIIFADIAHL